MALRVVDAEALQRVDDLLVLDELGDGLFAGSALRRPHARGEHQQELDEILARWTRTQDCQTLLTVLERAGVPAGLIYRPPEMLSDRHFAARQSIVAVPHPDFGELRMQNVARNCPRRPAPQPEPDAQAA